MKRVVLVFLVSIVFGQWVYAESNAHLLAQSYFNYDDINVSQGSVQFSENDLSLPGYNNLSLRISRQYNSRHYQSSSDPKLSGSKTFGPGFGYGWSLNIVQRAFYVNASHDEYDKIVIEAYGVASSYDFDPDSAEFRSSIPGNFQKPVLTTNGLAITGPDGFRYYYEQPMYSELHEKNNTIHLDIQGYLISRIEDAYGNDIRFFYGDYTELVTESWSASSDNSTKGVTRIVGMDAYDWLKDEYGSCEVNSEHETYRVNRVTDTKGRDVYFSWSYSRLAEVSYAGENGTTNRLRYDYDDSGRLTSVSINDKLLMSYTYKWVDTHFRHYRRRKYRTCKDFRSGDCAGDRFYDYKAESSNYGSPQHIRLLDGYLLASRTNRYGATISYLYSETLETTKNKTELQLHATHYVVNTKALSGDSGEDSYSLTFSYPKDSSGKFHNVKARYLPSYSDEDIYLYYFDEVTVSSYINQEPVLQDQHFTFNQGLLERKQYGDFEEVSSWNLLAQKKVYDELYVSNNRRWRYEYSYDENRNVIQRNEYVGNETAPSLQEFSEYVPSYTFEFAAFRNRLKSRAIKESGKQRLLQAYSYNPEGAVEESQQFHSEGSVKTAFYYDEKGRLISRYQESSDGELRLELRYDQDDDSDYLYSELNGKKTVKRFSRLTGKLLSVIDENGHESLFSYDDEGRLVLSEYPDETYSAIYYNDDESVVVHDHNGLLTSRYYDSYKRPTIIDRPRGLDIKRQYYFGNKIQAEYEGDALADDWVLVSETSYDDRLRPVSVLDPHWGVSTFAYDDVNKQQSFTDFRGLMTRSTFNDKQQIQATRSQANDTVYEQQFDYNALGNRTGFYDAKGRYYKSDYSDFGQLKTVYYPGDFASNTAWQEFSYSENNLLKKAQILDDFGETVASYEYDYDKENRLLGFYKNNQLEEWLSYDDETRQNALGRLSVVENNAVKSAYDYDAFGRVTTEETTLKELGLSYAIRNAYTQWGGLAQIQFPDAKAIDYHYSELRELKAVHFDNKEIVSYAYTDKGMVDELKLGSDIKIEYTYNDKDLLSGIAVLKSNGDVIHEYRYSYDEQARLSQGVYPNPMGANMMARQYSYDGFGHLKQVVLDTTYESTEQPNHLNYHYDYDKAGNTTTFSVAGDTEPVVVQANYSIRNELVEQSRADDRRIELAYDAEGRLIKKVKYEHGDIVQADEYSYNYHGQVEQINRNGTMLARYQYNHKRERVYAKTESAIAGKTIEKWYYNNSAGQIIGEGSPEQDYVVRYIYSGNEKIAMIRPDEAGNDVVYYFINNMQGTPMFIVTESGDIVSRIQLDDWGNLATFVVASNNEINYSGKKLDVDTGLYYFGQRYYDPELGRFLSHDPAKQTLNPYLYAGNNPVMFVDPDGEFFIAAIVAAAKWVAANKVVIAAAKGATAAASISAGAQWVAHGFDSSKINWDAVGQAAIGGAVGGVLGSGGGIWQTGNNAGLLETVGVNVGNQVTEGLVSSLVMGENYHMTEFGRDLGLGSLQGVHYYRNELNVGLPETLKEANAQDGVNVAANHHRLRGEVGNVKRVFSDGREAVYNSAMELVTNPLNMGTFNYVNPGNWRSLSGVMKNIGHFATDMLPYYYFGNTMYDGAWLHERVTGYSPGY